MKRILLCLSAALYLLFIHAEKIKHPALLYTPQRIEQAKISVRQDTRMSEAWNSIRKTADNLLQKTQLNKIDYLALSFLMTDEKKYADVCYGDGSQFYTGGLWRCPYRGPFCDAGNHIR